MTIPTNPATIYTNMTQGIMPVTNTKKTNPDQPKDKQDKPDNKPKKNPNGSFSFVV